MTTNHNFRIFAKPWKDLSLEAMAEHVKSLGFNQLEFPVRPGFWCEPDTMDKSLPRTVKQLGEMGVTIGNITTSGIALDDERIYAACAEAGISMNRVMFRVGDMNYWEAEKAARQQLDTALPLLEQYNIQIGIQNHSKKFVGINAMGLYHLVKDYDPKYVAGVWDPAHNSLEGEEIEIAMDILEGHMCMLILKNAFWRRTTGPEAELAEWEIYWTSGWQGRASWPSVAAKYKQQNADIPLCMAAEYTDEEAVDRLTVADLAYAIEVFA